MLVYRTYGDFYIKLNLSCISSASSHGTVISLNMNTLIINQILLEI